MGRVSEYLAKSALLSTGLRDPVAWHTTRCDGRCLDASGSCITTNRRLAMTIGREQRAVHASCWNDNESRRWTCWNTCCPYINSFQSRVRHRCSLEVNRHDGGSKTPMCFAVNVREYGIRILVDLWQQRNFKRLRHQTQSCVIIPS